MYLLLPIPLSHSTTINDPHIIVSPSSHPRPRTFLILVIAGLQNVNVLLLAPNKSSFANLSNWSMDHDSFFLGHQSSQSAASTNAASGGGGGGGGLTTASGGIAMGSIGVGGGLGLHQRGVGHGGGGHGHSHSTSSGKGPGLGLDSRRSSFDIEDALDIDDEELMQGGA